MSVETHRVLIGACGWKHQSWENDFYDDDLPEDWQLGFYSNEFSVVYVPASDWLDRVDMAEWVDDVSDIFRFILEMPEDILSDEQNFNTALTKAKDLGGLCLGLVFQLNPSNIKDAQAFQRQIQQAKEIAPVCIDKKDTLLTNEFKNILEEENISEVWNGKSTDSESLKKGPLAISHVLGNELDMAGLRKVVEVALSASTENCISVLCLDGNPPSLEKLRNAEIILNLL